MFGGLQIRVVDTWVQGYAWRPLTGGRRPPSKRDGRRGTRRAWKRRHPQGLGWRYGPVEPDHVITASGTVYCTRRQYEALKLAAEAQRPTLTPTPSDLLGRAGQPGFTHQWNP